MWFGLFSYKSREVHLFLWEGYHQQLPGMVISQSGIIFAFEEIKVTEQALT